MKGFFLRCLAAFIEVFSLFYFGLFITDYSFLYRKGFSNIAAFTVFFAFLLFILWKLDKGRFFNLYALKIARRVAQLKDIYLLWTAFCIIVLVFSALGIARHLSLGTMAWDMGIFEQAFWNTLHGDTFFCSIRGNISLLGDHFQPVLFLFLPFYALKPHVATLIILQAILLGISVFPLYLIAKNKFSNRFLIFSLVTSFVISKGLRGVGLSDFHPEGLIVPLSFFSYYFLVKRRNLLFAIACILLLFSKETTVFIIAGLGFYSLFNLKRRFLGAFLLLFSVLAWVLETKIIIPFFNNYNDSFFYYARLPFGMTYGENLRFIVTNFPRFLQFIFSPGKLEYVLRLTGSLVFLPFFAPSCYVLIFMPLTIILLASEKLSGYYSLTSHYVAAIMPFVYIAAICGLANAIAIFKQKKKANEDNIAKVFGIIIILTSLLFYGKTDAYKFNKFIKSISSNRANEKLSLASRFIPKQATLSASSNFIPHLCHRKYIYDWDPCVELSVLTEYVLIDFDFKSYLKDPCIEKIPEFFNRAKAKGYRIIYVNPQNTFFILHNPGFDKSAIEGFRGNII